MAITMSTVTVDCADAARVARFWADALGWDVAPGPSAEVAAVGGPRRPSDAPSLLFVALNDAIADGKDVSWIWDVDFEPLLARVEHLIASGDRAAELGVRCVYGGLDEDALEVEPDLARALDRGLALTPPGGELVVLPTYTAMLALQRILTERGHAKPYWERS